jgi:hypothetical protein
VLPLPPVGGRGKDEGSPLERALVTDPSIREAVYGWARGRAPDVANAQDLYAETLRLAIQRERGGKGWVRPER